MELADPRLVVDLGQPAGLPRPLSAGHRAVLENAEAAGCGDLDNSSISNVLVARGRDRGAT
jgi:3-hydroxyisobutyrate dehydrogenase-like beta-hydroxyacid dehydrogenase